MDIIIILCSEHSHGYLCQTAVGTVDHGEVRQERPQVWHYPLDGSVVMLKGKERWEGECV